jgi:hypothetical protein
MRCHTLHGLPTGPWTHLAQGSRWSWAWEDLNLRLHPDPKIHDEQAGGSTRRSAAEPGPSRWMRADSGGGLQGDLVAEGLQLADVVALGAFGTDTGVVEAGAEVLEVGL